MIRNAAIAVLVFALGSVAALAADFNGKWTADVQGRRGTETITFNFHVDGSALTGTVSTRRGDMDIANGKVDGDNVSFDQVMNFNGNQMTIHYAGHADGDTIKFTRQMGDRPGTEFTANRAGAAAPPPAQ